MTKVLTCTICPRSCVITYNCGKVEGNHCRRGKNWALREMTAPLRPFTTVVYLEGGELTMLPVRSQKPLPKEKIHRCLALANSLRVKAPVQAGQVLITDLAATGIELVATRSIGIME